MHQQVLHTMTKCLLWKNLIYNSTLQVNMMSSAIVTKRSFLYAFIISVPTNRHFSPVFNNSREGRQSYVYWCRKIQQCKSCALRFILSAKIMTFTKNNKKTMPSKLAVTWSRPQIKASEESRLPKVNKKTLQGIPFLHYIWIAPAEIVVVMALLYQTVGISFLPGLAYVVIMLPVQLALGKLQGRLRCIAYFYLYGSFLLLCACL